MKRIKIFLEATLISMALLSCSDQLDVKNPNQPVSSSASNEGGIIALAQGGVYVDGFRELKYYDGVPGYFWSGAIGFHEIMGDVVGEEAANIYGNQIGCPDYVILDDGTKVINPQNPKRQKDLLRAVNINSNAGNNPLYYEWAYMYNLNTVTNQILYLSDKVTFSGDAATKKGVLKAWAYFWKGFAYSRIGSIYYAGIINDDTSLAQELPAKTNGTYVSKEAIIAEANANFDKAISTLQSLTYNSDYKDVFGRLIPDFTKAGKGGILSPDAWIRTINTFKARNILVNTRVKDMTTQQWTAILDLTNNGVKETDKVFTLRSNENGDLLSPTSGTVAAKATGDPSGGITYKISERFIQDFKSGDKRFDNNFSPVLDDDDLPTAWIGASDRGNSFNTRWQMVDGGNGVEGVIVFSNRDPGATELYIATTYEENELMKAEALIYTGDIEGGLTIIDNIRTLQGAGLAAVAGTGLSVDEAKEELRLERRVGLAFRALSFYDARRWGVIDDVADGGGRKAAVVLDGDGNPSTDAIINYNFLDYWDVPDNELKYNPPAAGSAPTSNPTK
jgi:hypothetical protein